MGPPALFPDNDFRKTPDKTLSLFLLDMNPFRCYNKRSAWEAVPTITSAVEGPMVSVDSIESVLHGAECKRCVVGGHGVQDGLTG